MDSFKHYITEVALQASGPEAARHTAKYITPYIGKEGTHTIASKASGLNSGDKVTIHSHHVNDQGVHHIVVSKPGSSEKTTIPTSKVHKVGTKMENEGHKVETKFFERMKSRGLTPEGATPAGSTAGSDVPVINKKKKLTHTGRDVHGAVQHNGEVKKDTGAAFGQLTINHDPAKGGWHISDKARALRPRYAREIEKAGIIEHMNKHVPNPEKAVTTKSGRAKNVTIDHPSLKPADSYLQDHHVDFVHVGSHGTYKVGEHDTTEHGMPGLTGHGIWNVRQKQFGNNRARTVMFQPKGKKGLDKSHVNLDDDKHLDEFAETLGHGKASDKKPSPVKEQPKPESKPEPKTELVKSLMRQRIRQPILGKKTKERKGLR
jgi:hypothetical protein